MQVNHEHLEKILGVRVEFSVSIHSVGSVGEPSVGASAPRLTSHWSRQGKPETKEPTDGDR